MGVDSAACQGSEQRENNLENIDRGQAVDGFHVHIARAGGGR